jgi:hypothetical protein
MKLIAIFTASILTISALPAEGNLAHHLRNCVGGLNFLDELRLFCGLYRNWTKKSVQNEESFVPNESQIEDDKDS